MSEGKKEVCEVGISIDELPLPKPFSDEEAGEDSKTDVSEAQPDSDAVLPDLFDAEELAEVGLSVELADSTPEAQEEENGTSRAVETESDKAIALSDESSHQEASSGIEVHSTSEEQSSEFPDEVLPAPASAEAQQESASDPDATLPLSVLEDIESAANDGADLASEIDNDFIDQDLLVGQLENLSQQISELQREFEGKLKYDTHKDEIIDRLHSELQEYKQDILKKYILSIVMDVVKVADDIRKWMTYFRSLDVSQRDPLKLFHYLEAIPSDLEDVFYWHGVKPFSSEEGSFDPVRQRAIKKIPTDDPVMDKCVVHSIRPGYEWETKVVRQEMVAVYVYQEDQESLKTGIIDE
ncbi:MAG: nucleotide exchange factor GrpE [Desulfosarcina sp.]|nr:nucleotide exchange factor GrpE [Desulfobacterales bacterium]